VPGTWEVRFILEIVCESDLNSPSAPCSVNDLVRMKDLQSKSVLTSDAYDIGTVNDLQLTVED